MVFFLSHYGNENVTKCNMHITPPTTFYKLDDNLLQLKTSQHNHSMSNFGLFFFSVQMS